MTADLGPEPHRATFVAPATYTLHPRKARVSTKVLVRRAQAAALIAVAGAVIALIVAVMLASL